MSSRNSESDTEISQSVMPTAVTIPAIPIPLNKTFPWHRPRKQYIRENQWLFFTKSLVSNIMGTPWLKQDSKGQAELRYLTLPAIDYLDARVLGEYCRSQKIKLNQTGYIAELQSNTLVARAQIRERALIDAEYLCYNSQTYPRKGGSKIL